MEPWKRLLVYVVWSGLFFTGSIVSTAAQQAAGPEQHSPTAAQPLLAANNAAANKGEDAKVSELPDSPGATLAKSEDATQQQSANSEPWGAAASSPQTTQPQSSGNQAQPGPQKPVGTAVAETPHAGGVAASQPAGVAIAPTKQRRVRTIVLRMGAVIGAGAAVGTVVALTAATGSKPPGAH